MPSILRDPDRIASYSCEAQRSLFVEMAVEELDDTLSF